MEKYNVGKTMLKLELVLRTPMKIEREKLRRQKMVGNIQKRLLNSGDLSSQRELIEGMGVILLFVLPPKKSKMSNIS